MSGALELVEDGSAENHDERICAQHGPRIFKVPPEAGYFLFQRVPEEVLVSGNGGGAEKLVAGVIALAVKHEGEVGAKRVSGDLVLVHEPGRDHGDDDERDAGIEEKTSPRHDEEEEEQRHEDDEKMQPRQAGQADKNGGGKAPPPGRQERVIFVVEAGLADAEDLDNAHQATGDEEHEEGGGERRQRVVPEQVRAEKTNDGQPRDAFVEEAVGQDEDQERREQHDDLVEHRDVAIARVGVAAAHGLGRLIELGMGQVKEAGEEDGIARRVVGVGDDFRGARGESIRREQVAGEVAELCQRLGAQEFGGETLSPDELAGELGVVHRLRVVQAVKDSADRPDGRRYRTEIITKRDDEHGEDEGNDADQDLALADLN